MIITYESNLDDVSEPSVRHFLRSETARKSKIQGAVRGGFFCAAAVIFVFRERALPAVIIGAIVGFLLGASLNFFTYAHTVRSRIRKHLERETRGRLPALTVYRFEVQKLVCEHLGATVSFPLSELQHVSEDGERMEIDFGKVGLCTIPLRAFESAREKESFIQILKGEGGISEPSLSRAGSE